MISLQQIGERLAEENVSDSKWYMRAWGLLFLALQDDETSYGRIYDELRANLENQLDSVVIPDPDHVFSFQQTIGELMVEATPNNTSWLELMALAAIGHYHALAVADRQRAASVQESPPPKRWWHSLLPPW